MYTVLLVDDDRDILNNLESSIDWPVYGIEHVLCAADGLQALAVLARQQVDILITDISMPQINGLELIRSAQARQPDIRCILLSSYSDFAYAKEAIALGVENYLVKPVNVDELENSIRKSLDNIAMHRSVFRTLLSDNVLYRWVTGDISPEDFVIQAGNIGVNPYFRNYCVVLIRSSRKRPVNHVLAPFFMEMTKRCDLYRFINYEGHQVLIFGSHTLEQNRLCDELNQVIAPTSLGLTAAVGVVVDSAESVRRSYQSALETLLLYPEQEGGFAVRARADSVGDIDRCQLSMITEYLSAEDSEDIELPGWCAELFIPLADAHLDEINAFVDLLVVRLSLHLSTSGLIESGDKERILCNTFHFDEVPTLEELLQWFAGLLSVCRLYLKTHAGRFSPITFSAIAYIRENYSDYVSIKDFSAKFNMNASYMGLLFKKETGIYFNDYITQTRISHAIRLLKTSSLKIAEICAKVGFGNTSYFILCFKKQTGVSPAKFRQLHCNKHSI